MAGQIFGGIILWIVGLFILYLVIYTAVKDGINKSLIGQLIEKNYEKQVNKKSLLDHDLKTDDKSDNSH